MKTRVRFRMPALCLVAGLIFVSVVGCSSYNYGEIKSSIRPTSFDGFKDGTYEGDYSLFPVHVRVRLEIASGRVRKVDILEHFNGRGTPAEAIVARVVEAQSIGVEVVSGATHSSLSILKAIEDALTKAGR